MLRVILRQVVIKPHAVIERQAAAGSPSVLHIPLGVIKAIIPARPASGFGIIVIIAEDRVGVGIVGIERIGGIAIEGDGSASGGIGKLHFARALDVNAELDAVSVSYFAHV